MINSTNKTYNKTEDIFKNLSVRFYEGIKQIGHLNIYSHLKWLRKKQN